MSIEEDKITTINTATEARAIVLLAVQNAGRDKILGKIVEWNNTTDNDIDAEGDVWVANPQTGHWLHDQHLIEFAIFLADGAYDHEEPLDED